MSEKLLFAKPLPAQLVLFGSLITFQFIFLSAPSPVKGMLVTTVLTIIFLIVILWISASNRWLLKNFLKVPVFELRKYDALFGVLFFCCLVNAVSFQDFMIEISTQELDPIHGTRADLLVNDENEFFFNFVNFTLLGSFLFLTIVAATSLVKAERSLNLFKTSYVGALISYWYFFVGVHFLHKRHERLRQRVRVMVEPISK